MDALLMRLRASVVQAIGLGVAAGCGPLPGVATETGQGQVGTTDAPATTGQASMTTADAPTTSTSTGTGTSAAGETSTGTSDGQVGTDGPGSSTSGTSTSTGPGTSEADTTGGTTGVETTSGFDTTTGGPLCESSEILGPEISEMDAELNPGCDVTLGGFECWHLHRVCAPAPEGGCEACAPDCIGPLPEICGASAGQGIECGPYTDGDQCCHVVSWRSICGDGRPFMVDAVARTAAPRRRADWREGHVLEDMSEGADLDEAARGEIAALWAADALAEHASIASFARFTMQLLAHGAPSALVAAACAAQADEVEHARVCFAAARAYGAEVGPGPLEISGALAGPQTLADLATATVIEGCVGETLAAAELEQAAAGCEQAETRALLLRLAADELRHALLAWRTVQWALEVGDDGVRRAVQAAFAGAAALAGSRGAVDRLPAALLRRHGRLPAAEREALALRCVREVLAPCAAGLSTARASGVDARLSC